MWHCCGFGVISFRLCQCNPHCHSEYRHLIFSPPLSVAFLLSRYFQLAQWDKEKEKLWQPKTEFCLNMVHSKLITPGSIILYMYVVRYILLLLSLPENLTKAKKNFFSILFISSKFLWCLNRRIKIIV